MIRCMGPRVYGSLPSAKPPGSRRVRVGRPCHNLERTDVRIVQAKGVRNCISSNGLPSALSGLLQARSPGIVCRLDVTLLAGELACPCMPTHHFSSVFRRASCRAPTASAGQCSLSGGTPSSAAIRSSVVSLRHSSSVRPTISSVSLDPAAMVGPQP